MRCTLAPGAPEHEQGQQERHQQERHRPSQFDSSMQDEVVRVVDDQAKALAGIEGGVVRVVQHAGAPAGPGVLGREMQRVLPQHLAADATGATRHAFDHRGGKGQGHGVAAGRQQRPTAPHGGRSPQGRQQRHAAQKDPMQHAGARGGERTDRRQQHHAGSQRPAQAAFELGDQVKGTGQTDGQQGGQLVALAQIAVDLATRGSAEPGGAVGNQAQRLGHTYASVEHGGDQPRRRQHQGRRLRDGRAQQKPQQGRRGRHQRLQDDGRGAERGVEDPGEGEDQRQKGSAQIRAGRE